MNPLKPEQFIKVDGLNRHSPNLIQLNDGRVLVIQGSPNSHKNQSLSNTSIYYPLTATTAAPLTSKYLAGRIAFGASLGASLNDQPDYQIYVMNGNGTGLTNLTNNAADDSLATWSPE